MSAEKLSTPAKQTLAEKIRERHPDWPDMNVTFYFSAHANHLDMAGIEPYMKEADIFLYENAANSDREVRYRKEDLQFLNALSTNPSVSLQEIFKEYNVTGTTGEHRIRGAHGSGMAIGTIDIGNSPIEQRMVQRMETAMHTVTPGSGNYDEVLENYRYQLQMYGELQVERERMMLGNFEGVIKSLLESRPDMKDKENLNVLISMGSAHTTLRHKFTEAGIESDKHFSAGKTQSFDYEHELIRTYMYGRQPSEELIRRAFTDFVIEGIYYDNPDAMQTTPTDEWTVYKRRLVSSMSDEQMAHIFELWNQKDKETAEEIQEYMKSEGFGRLPDSALEVIGANFEATKKRRRGLGGAAIS